MKPKHTLSKNERLKSYRRIRLLFAEGERFRQAPLMVYVLLAPKELPAPATQLDFSATESIGLDKPNKDAPTHASNASVGPVGASRVISAADVQMGVSVGARYFKKAVQRNLLKRRIREAYRKQKHLLEALLAAGPYRMDLFLVYAEKTETDYATIYAAVSKAIEKLTYYLDKKTTNDQL